MIKVSLKDGSILKVEKGSSILDVAKKISEGLARVATCGEINNEIKDLSPLKNLKKLTNLKANPQMIYEDLVLAKDKNVSVDYNILNRNGDKLTPTSISIKDNRTWEYTNLNVKDCIDEDGKISFSTENFYSGIHTVYLTYEDKVDNYTTNITFIVDTRER